jgi:hypothetical protein
MGGSSHGPGQAQDGWEALLGEAFEGGGMSWEKHFSGIFLHFTVTLL